ncbi:MAG: hypothetical protein LLF89_04665 [Spirochaetaceae bacterium]|nr:hypothetical protein [Spirochaetaceae bacterium]
MKKWEKIILDSRTPDEYVENSLKSKLKPPEKARLALSWMDATGFTKTDILYARNRNPYWKKKKMEGAEERTSRRLAMHDYSKGKSVNWTPKRLEEFLELNRKDASGRYLYRDWELADHFNTTIPSIQYMRRKYIKVRSLLGPRARKEKVLSYMGCSELVLLNGGPARQ